MTELLENSYSIIKSDQMFSWKPLPGAGNSRAQRGQPGLHCLVKMFMMHFSLSQTLSKCHSNHHNRNISARPVGRAAVRQLKTSVENLSITGSSGHCRKGVPSALCPDCGLQ